MKKIVKAALLAFCLTALVCGAAACAQNEGDPKQPGFHYYTTQSGEKVLSDYVPEEGVTSLTIAEDVDKIQAGAFSGNGTVREIVVGPNVTEIAPGAFAGMQALESITLPFTGEKADAVNAAKTFGYIFGTEEYDGGVAVTQSYGSGSATYYLPETLKNVTISGSNDYVLPNYAFYSMSNLDAVTLTGDIVSIGDYAFYDCYYLTNFSVPASVESIGAQAFVNCNRLNHTASVGADLSVKGNVSFASGSALTTIGEYAFAGTKLTSIDLSGLTNLTKIQRGAFAGSIVSEETDGTVTTLDSKLETVKLPATVTVIESKTFYECNNLVTVICSDALTEIRGDAFAGCDKLRIVKNASYAAADPTDAQEGVIVLPSSVTKVRAGAFVNIGNGKITYTLVNNAPNAELIDGWRNSDGKWTDLIVE